MVASIDMNPPQQGGATMFFKSQLFTKAKWPPQTTNLDGQVALVTGSSSGLGLEASRQLLSFGLSRLIIAVRSLAKGEKAALELRLQYPSADIQVWLLEMESYESIQTLARQADAELPRLDIVILNAGVQAADFRVVPSTGHEQLIQVNYISTMLLAILFLPVLKNKSPQGFPGRLTIISSGTARAATLTHYKKDTDLLSGFDDINVLPWNAVSRYAVSKLLGHLFLINLVRYVDADDVVVNLADPGLVKDTNLQGFITGPIAAFFYTMKAVLGRDLSVGASTYIDAAVVKGTESHGCFVNNWEIMP